MGASVSCPPRRNVAMIKTGTYTGNGVDNRNIDIGVNLAAKENVTVVVIGPDNGSPMIYRIEFGQGDSSYPVNGGGGAAANKIQEFTANGFRIGSHSQVNFNSYLYKWSVWWTEY